MAHFLLGIYLLSGLFGAGGLVLCQEADASVAWESFLQTCCEEVQDQAGMGLPQTEESSSLVYSGFETCLCEDVSASIALFHRQEVQDLSLLLIGEPFAASCPAGWQADVGADVSTSESGAIPRRRADLIGHGFVPRVLRN